MRRVIAYLSALALLLLAAPASTGVAVAAVTLGPTSADDMNARSQQIDGLGDGWDSGRTHALPDGRWLTLTGDAIAEDGQLWPVYDNAAVIWDTTGQRRIASPHPGGHFFPRWDDGSEFWPNDFFTAGTRLYVIGSRVLTQPGGGWVPMGAYGAVVDVPAGGDPAWLRYFPTPSSMLDDTAVQWSGAIAYDGTWVYVHGVKDRPDMFHARDGGYTARVSLARLEVPHRWQFRTATSWAGRADLAVSTIPTGGPLDGTTDGYTLHRRPNGEWAVTTKAGGNMANVLGRYTSTTPYGPWTWQPLATVGAGYLPGAMPDLPTADGGLLVQWSRSGTVPLWAEVPQ